MSRLIGILAVLLVGLLGSVTASQAEKRVALVIGNSAYRNAAALPNPRNDAEDVATALRRAGFDALLGIDLDQPAMQEIAIRFSRAARDADVALFYYSGHAMQFAGVNYLMPVDARLTDEADLRRMARVDDIVFDLQKARNLKILVLDSCRDNPLAEEFKRSIGRTRAGSTVHGLAKIESPQGTIVSFSTQAGSTAEDGTGRNSPYTSAFLKHIETQAEIGTVFRRISADVYEATKRTQLPELSLSLIGEFYLKGQPAPSAGQVAADEVAWGFLKSAKDADALRAFLAQFPASTHKAEAEERIAALEPPRLEAPRDTSDSNKAGVDHSSSTKEPSSNLSQPLLKLGLELVPLNEERRRRSRVAADVEGVVVSRVDPNSAAAAWGLQAGDVLRGPETPRQMLDWIEEKRISKPGPSFPLLLFYSHRDGRMYQVWMTQLKRAEVSSFDSLFSK